LETDKSEKKREREEEKERDVGIATLGDKECMEK